MKEAIAKSFQQSTNFSPQLKGQLLQGSINQPIGEEEGLHAQTEFFDISAPQGPPGWSLESAPGAPGWGGPPAPASVDDKGKGYSLKKKKHGEGRRHIFFTPPPTELDFHRDQAPLDLELSIYQIPIEFNLPKVRSPTELTL